MEANYRAIQDRNTMKETIDLVDRLQSPVVLYPRVMK